MSVDRFEPILRSAQPIRGGKLETASIGYAAALEVVARLRRIGRRDADWHAIGGIGLCRVTWSPLR